MIRRYNKIQLLNAALSLVGGLICYFFAYLFFRYIPLHLSHVYGVPLKDSHSQLLTAGIMILIFFTGFGLWKKEGGLNGYHDSAFYHHAGSNFLDLALIGRPANGVTGSSYYISRFFLSGPILLLKAGTMMNSRIPYSVELEERLGHVLSILRAANKWEGMNVYPACFTEILHLAQMGQIDFSSHTVIPRIKAHL